MKNGIYGIALHKFIELYLIGKSNTFIHYKSCKKLKQTSLNLIIKQLETFIKMNGLTLYKTEYSIKYNNIIGKIDVIFKNEFNKYLIIDWKSVKINKKLPTEELKMFKINKSNCHIIQVNVYRHLLEMEVNSDVNAYICYISGKRTPTVTFHKVNRMDECIVNNIINYNTNLPL